MSHKPPTFASSPDPLDTDDWLKSIEKMLNIAQCTDRKKMLYASGRLIGPAADWWDSYTAAHDAADTITWAEFMTQFRNHHIPAGLMKIKKKEFLSLKQGSMSVSEYHDKFIQLSRMKLLKMRGSKSILLKDFLGHIISDGGISVDPAKVKEIMEWSVPTTVTEIQSFLELAGYHRRFIEGFSKIAKPMTSLLEKGREFKWD
jgi:hypothetical protein